MQWYIFENRSEAFVVGSLEPLTDSGAQEIAWLTKASPTGSGNLRGAFRGPRRGLVTPWSTNATEILAGIGLKSVKRIERFEKVETTGVSFDPMLEAIYEQLSGDALTTDRQPLGVELVDDIAGFSAQHGLALSPEEVLHLNRLSERLNRRLTDAEVYAFGQINSEHCRHKIFRGQFVVDGEEKTSSLFDLIKETTKRAPGEVVSAYSDNVAFIKGPTVRHFSPGGIDGNAAQRSSAYAFREAETVISLKAETHNFPTTVEPFNGAATGSGGEIRDRMAGGKGSLPIAGSAVYMTSPSRMQGWGERPWIDERPARPWRFQSPERILVRASDGASDFGNKFGQPLITGSVRTFEGDTPLGFLAYDRAVMLAGGVGIGFLRDAIKEEARAGDALVVLGGDNYRIGMAGGSVGSLGSGTVSSELELSAVQRSNPEMQKRVYNVIRALCESARNPVRLVHDHGAGGHINCLSELLTPGGGSIFLDKLPLGDESLSPLEILCNESQERMGLIVSAADVPLLMEIAEREKAPCYVVGEAGDDGVLRVVSESGPTPFCLPLAEIMGATPRVKLEDISRALPGETGKFVVRDSEHLESLLAKILPLESVGSKEWLTTKVDRSVTGLVAQQQCVGKYQLPLANVGVVATDYTGTHGIALAIGERPVAGTLDDRRGAVLAVAEALTNLMWAPLAGSISSVVLSANWMWAARQPGHTGGLYHAVEALSQFAIALNIAVPTGKDSLSMSMKYDDGTVVPAPGTVVVSATARVDRAKETVTPDLKPIPGSRLVYLDMSGDQGFPLGGSALQQVEGRLEGSPPQVSDPRVFREAFGLVQQAIMERRVLAGHDISDGGVLSAVLEMAFSGDCGVCLNVASVGENLGNFLFCEKPAALLQIRAEDEGFFLCEAASRGLTALVIGDVDPSSPECLVVAPSLEARLSLRTMRRLWHTPAALYDALQTERTQAAARVTNRWQQPLSFTFPPGFSGSLESLGLPPVLQSATTADRPVAAVLREKGSNGERELAAALHIAGFETLDVTMSDLERGKASLRGVRLLAFPGGFSHSDVCGAGQGWAATCRFHPRVRDEISKFYARADTLSIGVCNGCQVMVALEVVNGANGVPARLDHNLSGRFESTFVAVDVRESSSVFFSGLSGARLGIWVAHGEGRFVIDETVAVPLVYTYDGYPGNPNGSARSAAAVTSLDGRHLAIMPHLERSIFPWQWPYYPLDKKDAHEVTPWVQVLVNARRWVESHR